jgi:hypothetical protein
MSLIGLNSEQLQYITRLEIKGWLYFEDQADSQYLKLLGDHQKRHLALS